MKVGFIGAGKMAEAMMSAILTSHEVHVEDLVACDISEERRKLIAGTLGVTVFETAEPVVEFADVIFLAVKPQFLNAAVAPIVDKLGEDKLVISIAAGKTTEAIGELLPQARIIRVMPNLACTVGASMSAFCLGSRATFRDGLNAAQLLGSVGRVLALDEEQFDAVTALSGSGPAFFAYFVDCMVDAAMKLGMQRDDALRMAEYTMYGTGKLLVERGIEPDALIAAVSSAKGTTVEGMSVLEPSDVQDVIGETLKAAARRSRELRE